jgi:uncharacterized protein
VTPPAYRPPWWYRGRHLQTLWGPALRRGGPPLRRERWPTPDGDVLDLDWVDAGGGAAPAARSPLLVVLHGLEGSSRSHYARGLLAEIRAAGWRGVVLHFRSCSGELNRLPRFYHSGDTGDLDWVVARLAAREPAVPIGLVGVSLGGNVALKWLGERGAGVPAEVHGAVGISTPFDLGACAEALDHGPNRLLYTANFLRTMKAKLAAKAALLDGRLDLPAALRARTFAEYDRLVTAPLYGFADERDYWARASSGPFLPGIRRPCLLINALNDPFVPAASLPAVRSAWLEPALTLEGGHAGFLEGPWGRRSWAERRAVTFLTPHLAG